MFIRNCWYVASWAHEIGDELFAISIINEPVVIYRRQGGRFVALENRCCHRFAPLSKGRLEDGCNLRCMYHGLKFDPQGNCIEIPGQDKIPDQARVKSYPVVEKDGWVWVWMGNPAKADNALIPNAVGPDNSEYVLRSGRIDYDADYELINDNLTDFSHLAYVHSQSFGATEAWARVRPNVKRIDRGIRVSRWLASQEANADGRSIGLENADDATAMWQTYDFLAPGILLMYSAAYPLSQMPEDRITPPTGEPLSANFTSQAVTPMTEQTSRYFFSWGPRAVDGGEKAADEMFSIAQMAFAEDKEMIEAQQKIINLKPMKEVLTSADVGPVQMRSTIRQLAKADDVESMS